MKKIFTFAAAMLMAVGMWAETESNPTEVPAKDNAIVGVSYTIAGTYNAGASGSKIDPMPDKGVKFRTNKSSGSLTNAIEFTVNQGHVINGITLIGVTNTNGKEATLGSIYVDGTAWNGTFATTLAAKDASAASTIEISGIAAEQSVVFVFSNLNGTSQALLCYTVTYDEGTPKTPVDTVETLTAATINGYPLAQADFTKLSTEHTLTLTDSSYVLAPTVTFTKKVVTTYDDQSTKTDTVDVDVVAEALGESQWKANITLGDNTYSITMQKAASYTVTYKMMEGSSEIVLGTEIVAAGGHPAEYAQYEVMPLSTFNGWFDADYIEEVNLAQVVVNSDTSFYADFDKAYAESIDFEQMVLNNGKSYDVKSALTANFYDYKTIDALDSLNNDKGAARNEPYLGLKIKKKGGYLACNVLPGTTIRIKFGYVAADVLAIAGTDTMTLKPTNNKLADMEFPIMVETLVKLQTTSDKTVVIKQIMVDEPIVTWMYPITYAEAENGKVEGWTIAFPHEKVNLTVTPDSAYHVVSVTAGNEVLLPDTASNYSFEMPGQATTVSATFAADEPVVPTLYTVTLGTYEHGTVAFIEPNEGNKYEADAEVRLSVTPDEGYELEAISLEGIDLAIPVVDGVATFNMPAQDVTVLATFKAAAPQPTLYTVTLGTYEHGAVAFIEPNEGNKYAENAEVRLSVTPDEGFEVEAISLEGIDLAIPVVDGVASFNMPAQDVTVLATFKAKEEGFENIDASTKAVKFIEDGQLYILKNGVKYNTQGAVVNQ